MQNFIMLTRLISEEVNPTFNITNKEMVLAEKVRQYCPEIEWVANYAIIGPWDYIDIFRAYDIDMAMRVSAMVRHYGGCHTEIWPAVQWDKFAENMNDFVQVLEKN